MKKKNYFGHCPNYVYPSPIRTRWSFYLDAKNNTKLSSRDDDSDENDNYVDDDYKNAVSDGCHTVSYKWDGMVSEWGDV